MPKLTGIKPCRSTCFCEEGALLAAGVATRCGLFLDITDLVEADRIARQHHEEQHADGPAYEPMMRPIDSPIA